MNKFVEQDGRERHRRHLRNGFSSQQDTDESLCSTWRNGDCAQCPAYDLCRKRVLIVGGIERMEKAYRKLVEDRGGIFEYHAGHMKSGGKGLENSVQRADLVLCPVNCNSHGACLKVKSLGKKFKKPVHMLRNFSLSAVARTMEELHAPN